MPRVVSAETLDSLAEHDPAAMQSRRDLQRVHRVMGTRGIVLDAMRGMAGLRQEAAPLRILELGAGDGSLMLGVARRLKGYFPAVHLTLMDRQALVSPDTLAGYAEAGWTATSNVMDVLIWADNVDVGFAENSAPVWDLVVANLFIHHFEGPQLTLLLQAIAARSLCFFACEPRRSRVALAGSHLIGAIGANAVTREDAVLSVHAGFSKQDISALWPVSHSAGANWALKEYAAGFFSHCFIAQRKNQLGAPRP